MDEVVVVEGDLIFFLLNRVVAFILLLWILLLLASVELGGGRYPRKTLGMVVL